MSVIVSLFAFAAVAASQASTSTDEAKPPEKKICKADPEATDSRIRRKICKTASEWASQGKKNSQTGAQQQVSSDR